MAQKPVGLLCKFLSWTGVLLTAFAVQAAPDLQSPTVVPENSPKTQPPKTSSKGLQKKKAAKQAATDNLKSTASMATPKKPTVVGVSSTSQEIKNSGPSKLSGSSTVALQTLSVTQLPKSAPAEESKIISGSATLSYSRSLVNHEDGSDKQSRSVLLKAGGAVFSDYTLAGKLAYEQNLKDPEDFDAGISDLSLLFSPQPKELARWLAGSWYLATAVPLSDRSVKGDNLQGVLGAGYTFNLTEAVVPMGLETSLTLGASKNFQKYETDTAGQVLNSYGIKEIFDVAYTYKKWKMSLDFIHRHSFAYDGYVGQSFEHTEELEYSILPKWKVALGHTNAGSWLRANMQETNLKLFSEDNSLVYGSTEVAF